MPGKFAHKKVSGLVSALNFQCWTIGVGQRRWTARGAVIFGGFFDGIPQFDFCKNEEFDNFCYLGRNTVFGGRKRMEFWVWWRKNPEFLHLFGLFLSLSKKLRNYVIWKTKKHWRWVTCGPKLVGRDGQSRWQTAMDNSTLGPDGHKRLDRRNIQFRPITMPQVSNFQNEVHCTFRKINFIKF